MGSVSGRLGLSRAVGEWAWGGGLKSGVIVEARAGFFDGFRLRLRLREVRTRGAGEALALWQHPAAIIRFGVLLVSVGGQR